MPDAHVSSPSISTVLVRVQHFVYEVLRMDARRLEPLPVFTDFAEAEQMQVAFFEAFRQDALKVLLVPFLRQHFLVDAHIEASHMHIYCARCASSGLRSTAAGQPSSIRTPRSAAAAEHPAAAERVSRAQE